MHQSCYSVDIVGEFLGGITQPIQTYTLTKVFGILDMLPEPEINDLENPVFANEKVCGPNIPMKDPSGFQVAKAMDSLEEELIGLLRSFLEVSAYVRAINELHDDVASHLVRVQIVAENAHDVLVRNLVEQLNLLNEVREERLPITLELWRVLLAGEILADQVVMKENRLAARAFPKLSDELIVFPAEELDWIIWLHIGCSL